MPCSFPFSNDHLYKVNRKVSYTHQYLLRSETKIKKDTGKLFSKGFLRLSKKSCYRKRTSEKYIIDTFVSIKINAKQYIEYRLALFAFCRFKPYRTQYAYRSVTPTGNSHTSNARISIFISCEAVSRNMCRIATKISSTFRKPDSVSISLSTHSGKLFSKGFLDTTNPNKTKMSASTYLPGWLPTKYCRHS